MSLIPVEQYLKIIEALPILCVDIVARNARGEYLLVKRANQPKKGHWWPIGGRVLKGETLEQAAVRKLREESGLEAKSVEPLGYYESVADASPFGLPFPYHTVSVVFSAFVDDRQEIVLDGQSVEWKRARELPAGFRIKPFHAFEPGGSKRRGARLSGKGR